MKNILYWFQLYMNYFAYLCLMINININTYKNTRLFIINFVSLSGRSFHLHNQLKSHFAFPHLNSLNLTLHPRFGRVITLLVPPPSQNSNPWIRHCLLFFPDLNGFPISNIWHPEFGRENRCVWMWRKKFYKKTIKIIYSCIKFFISLFFLLFDT